MPYTDEQILCGLRQVWDECGGRHRPFDAETLVVEYARETSVLDVLHEFEVFSAIERCFHFHADSEDWGILFQLNLLQHDPAAWEREIAARLRMRDLMEFIAARAEPVSLGPVSILGRNCAAASAFYGIERVARQIAPRAARFGPSTPIRHRLNGPALRRFWDQLRRLTEDRLVQLQSSGLMAWRVLRVTSGLAIFAGFIGLLMWRKFQVEWTDLVWLALGILWTRGIERLINPLPEGIRTFRDLARRVAVCAPHGDRAD